MNTISYYPSVKEYETAKTIYPQSDNALELVQLQNELGIGIKFEEINSVKNPRFYICRGQGFLQLNRSNFFAVTIPDQLEPILRHSSTVEVVIAYGEGSTSNVPAIIEQVLRVPEYVTHDMTRQVEDAGPKSDSDQDTSSDEDTRPVFPHTPPAEVFFGWLIEDNMDADIIMEYHKGDDIFALVHNGKIMMLVSFFDEPEQEWLPDEEEFNEEPPLWFCSNRHRRSPVYTLKLAAEYLKEHGIENVLPLTILSDHIDLISADVIADEWKKNGVSVCYCFRQEDFVAPFAEIVKTAEKDHPEYQDWDEEDLLKVKNILHDFQERQM